MATVKIDYTVKCNQDMYNEFEKNFGTAELESLKVREKKYQDFSIELTAADISGKSEKQVKYAEDLRDEQVFNRVKMFAKKVNGLSVGGKNIDVINAECAVCAQLEKTFANAGVNSMSELTAKIVADEAKTLLSMSDAGEIIDYCLNGGISTEILMKRKNK